jgi:predicted kinase
MAGHRVHVICGSTGAGKTTYARRLSDVCGGVRFSIDEWMSALFWMDTPQPLEVAWSMERVERCFHQIWEVAKQVAHREISIVLDLGFSQASSRERFYRLAAEAGLSAQLHWLDVPAAVRWGRIETRNRERGTTYALPFDVTREMFDFMEKIWEPPTEHEMAAHDGVRAASD